MEDMRLFSTFRGDFPHNASFDDYGNIEVPAGQELIDALVAMLRSDGWHVVDAKQRSFYGWEFSIMIDRIEILAVLQEQPGDAWLLIVNPRNAIRNLFRWRKVKRAHKLGIEIVDRLMRADSRFRDIIWMTQREYRTETS